MKKLLLLSALLFLISPCFSQNEAPQKKIKETIKLDGTSFGKVLKLEVVEGKTLRYTVKGTISEGKFSVIVYGPTGEKEKGFDLNACGGSSAKGSLQESNSEPAPGIWTFKFENIDSKGSVTFLAGQSGRGI